MEFTISNIPILTDFLEFKDKLSLCQVNKDSNKSLYLNTQKLIQKIALRKIYFFFNDLHRGTPCNFKTIEAFARNRARNNNTRRLHHGLLHTCIMWISSDKDSQNRQRRNHARRSPWL